MMEKKRDSFFLNKKHNKADKNDKKSSKRQEEFDRNRDVKIMNKENDQDSKPEKKPFDKKTYRLKKYSKKYKLEQWEEQRKKKLIRDYQKEMKNDNVAGTYKPKSFDEDTTDSTTVGRYVRHPDIIEKETLVKVKRDPFQKAKDQYNKVKQDKEKKIQERERVREERNKKIQEYKKKKHERFKKLSKKTKRGQPMMTGRLELLLEKLQQSK